MAFGLAAKATSCYQTVNEEQDELIISRLSTKSSRSIVSHSRRWDRQPDSLRKTNIGGTISWDIVAHLFYE